MAVVFFRLMLPACIFSLTCSVSAVDQHNVQRFLSLPDSFALQPSDPNILPSIKGLLFDELGGKEFVYIINPGNAGDALIQYGTILVFDHLGLQYRLGDLNEHYENSVLVYAGAGNLVGLYPHCKAFLGSNAPLSANNTILLLPATIKDEDETLETLEQNVKVVTRERKSYAYVKRFLPQENVFLSKDMAFYIPDLDPVVETYKSSFPQFWTVGHMFRVDSEQTDVSLPDDNHDWEHELPGVAVVKDADREFYKRHIQNVAHRLFKKVASASEVWTNRFHVCIAASMLGRAAHCLPNSYWKNEAMFNFSINGQFPDAHFENAAAFTGPSQVSAPLASLMQVASARSGVAPMTLSRDAGFIVASALAMVIPRQLRQWSEKGGEATTSRLDAFVLLADVLVWYAATPFYMTASLPLLSVDDGLARLLIIAFVQVFAGIFLLPLSGASHVLQMDRRAKAMLMLSGCAYFCGSFLVLRSLQHAVVPFVMIARCLELVTTALLMTLVAGEAMRPLQVFGLGMALAGGLLAACPSAVAFHVIGSTGQPLKNSVRLLLASAMYSFRNVLWSEGKDSAAGMPKLAMFAVASGCSIVPATLGIGLLAATGGVASVLDAGIDLRSLVISTLAFGLYNTASFLVLMRVRPVVHSLFLLCKRVALMLLSWFGVHHLPPNVGTLSVCLTVAGCALYEAERRAVAVLDVKNTKLGRLSVLRFAADYELGPPLIVCGILIFAALLA